MIVAGLQTDIAWEDPPTNFERVEEMAARAMAEEIGASGEPPVLLVLPEMFATGFSMNSELVSAFSEETRAFLAELASRLSVHVLGGYAEPAQPLPANGCSVFAPSGDEVLHFRKLHPFSMAKEDQHYVGGDALPTADIGGIRVTALICYDLRFPEPFRPAAPRTDLYCVIANWPDPRREAWSALLRARAIENQAYVLGVNRVGMGSGLAHSGDTALFDPMGEVLDAVTPYEVGVARGDVNPKEVKRVRRHLNFLKDRRPDLYRQLEEDSVEGG
jgi:predicted amidohydrolase